MTRGDKRIKLEIPILEITTVGYLNRVLMVQIQRFYDFSESLERARSDWCAQISNLERAIIFHFQEKTMGYNYIDF